MRVQSNAFLATHAGYRETELYGPEQPDYRKRGCIWPPCTHDHTRVPDDAAHVLFDCPHFAPQRRQYLAPVNAILASIGFSLDDLQTRARQTSFLASYSGPCFCPSFRSRKTTQAYTPKSSAKPAPS